jgi:hypothetical protein
LLLLPMPLMSYLKKGIIAKAIVTKNFPTFSLGSFMVPGLSFKPLLIHLELISVYD